MSRRTWLTDEPSVAVTLRQALALWRVGFRRPFLVGAIAALLSAAIALFVTFGRREYAPKFVLRVVEAEHPAANAPPLKRQLAEYVRQAIFTSEPLLEQMRRHGLYPGLLRRNSRAALDAFREDISIEVYQNYFVEDRAPGHQRRSARLSVGFRSKDPALALAVTRELGALIVSHELSSRREQAASAARGAAQARDILVAAWQQRSAAIVAKQAEIAKLSAPDPQRQVELIGMLGSLAALDHQVEALERRATALDIGASLERRGIGMSFQVVDDGSLPGRAGQVQALLWTGAATLFFGLPLLALSIGACSPVEETLA
ncbi:MAG TPA: hypothetical protein VNG33_12990 [Polyangiaceae bacterium]|nr:hypothetical protein [Polyangiaceae bacterium]